MTVICTTDPAAMLSIMAQEADESARSFESLAARQQYRGTMGAQTAKKAREDAAVFRAKAAACRTGMAAIGMAKAQPQLAVQS